MSYLFYPCLQINYEHFLGLASRGSPATFMANVFRYEIKDLIIKIYDYLGCLLNI